MIPYQQQLAALMAQQQQPQNLNVQNLLGGANGVDILAQVNGYVKQAVQNELQAILAPHIAQYQSFAKETPVAPLVAQESPSTVSSEERMLLDMFRQWQKAEEESGKAFVSHLSKFARFAQSKVDKPE